MEAGAGSLWNKNSWHWEEKNYTKWAKETMKEMLEKIEFEKDGYVFTIGKAFTVTGEASINIRKGKKLCLYSFELSMSWRASPKGKVQEIFSGQVKVFEFSQDDDELDLEITADKTDDTSRRLKGIVEKEFRGILGHKLEEFMEAYKAQDSSQEQLKKDQARREEEEHKMRTAEECKGKEKQEIFVEEKKREEELKVKELAKAPQVKQIPNIAATKVGGVLADQVKGEGSVWNPNSYFWEEKPMTEWSQIRIKELLVPMNLDSHNINIEVTAVEKCDGEASLSIRKGKKIYSYEFLIKCKWTGESEDETGTQKVEGYYEIIEFSSAYPDFDFEIIVSSPGSNERELGIRKYMLKEGTKLIRRQLMQYVLELKEK